MNDIADGGAALTANAKLQYQDMTENERKEITKGVLKYCELDTLAMVMIYEHFKEEVIK
jgi:ribosome recycling factor